MTLYDILDKCFMKLGSDDQYGTEGEKEMQYILYVVASVLLLLLTLSAKVPHPNYGYLANFIQIFATYYTMSITYWNIRVTQKLKKVTESNKKV